MVGKYLWYMLFSFVYSATRFGITALCIVGSTDWCASFCMASLSSVSYYCTYAKAWHYRVIRPQNAKYWVHSWEQFCC